MLHNLALDPTHQIFLKIRDIFNAHGLIAPDESDSQVQGMDKLYVALSYFDNEVRGQVAIAQEAQDDTGALKKTIAEQAEALDRVKVMAEKFPVWVNSMAKVCHEMIEVLTVHHKFEHAPAEPAAPVIEDTPPDGEGHDQPAV